MIGTRCISTWSITQATVAKSSAESELYGVVEGACEAPGFLALASDFAIDMQSKILVDVGAAIGIIERRELARVRHDETNMLCLQETEARRKLPLVKNQGSGNPAGLTTNKDDISEIGKHIDL